MAEQPITREWLEERRIALALVLRGGFSDGLTYQEQHALLQWALESQERERRLREALESLLLGLAAAPIEAEMFTKYLWRPETNARVLLKELKEVPSA